MRARHLFAAWAIWWSIPLLQLTPAFVGIWKATHAEPAEGKGNISLSVDNGIVQLDAEGISKSRE